MVSSSTANCAISPALHLHPSLSPPPLSSPSLTISPLCGQIISHQRTLPDGHIAAGLSCHNVLFFWVGGAGIHACNLSQYWRPFPQELVVNPACLEKVLLLEMNSRVPGCPVGFSFLQSLTYDKTVLLICVCSFSPFCSKQIRKIYVNRVNCFKGERKNLFHNCSVGQISLWSIFLVGMFYIKTMN